MNKRKNQKGFTLIEVVISAGILAIMMVVVYALLASSTRSFQQQSVQVWLDGNARDQCDRISRELLDAGRSTLFPLNPNNSTTLSFQRVTGFTGGALVYGPVIQYSWVLDPAETDNGVDDDGDGLVDEGRLIRTEAGQTVILIRDALQEDGLQFTRLAGQDSVNITLTLQRRDGSRTVVTRVATTTVRLRNP